MVRLSSRQVLSQKFENCASLDDSIRQISRLRFLICSAEVGFLKFVSDFLDFGVRDVRAQEKFA